MDYRVVAKYVQFDMHISDRDSILFESDSLTECENFCLNNQPVSPWYYLLIEQHEMVPMWKPVDMYEYKKVRSGFFDEPVC